MTNICNMLGKIWYNGIYMIYFFQTRPCLPTWSVVCTIFQRSSQRVRPQHIQLQEQSLYCSGCCTGNQENRLCQCWFTPVYLSFIFIGWLSWWDVWLNHIQQTLYLCGFFSKNLLITSYCIVDLELYIYIVPLLRPLRFLVVVCDKITNSNTEQ